MAKQLKIYFYSMDGVGHVNACVGVAQELANRQHKITFLNSRSYKGHFLKFGFEEIVVEPEDDSGRPAEDPIKAMADSVLKSGLFNNKTAMEKAKLMKGPGKDIMKRIFDKSVKQFPLIAKAIDDNKPDLIVVDHFFVPPCIVHSGIPWVSLVSACPLPLYDSDKLPPFKSGLSINEPEKWKEFLEIAESSFQSQFGPFQVEAFKMFGYDVVGNENKFLRSEYLNIYGYPEELDYNDVVPQPPKHFRIDAFIRCESEPFELPEEFKKKIQPNDKLIYVSMGSMGSVDVNLMKRIVEALKDSSYKYIVSKGLRHEEYELADNMYGEKFLPQTNVLPLVDLVITHGGNNTITETFSFGKPMIVMPLFADQFDNAQRLVDKNYGARLEPNHFTKEEILNTIDRLLNDEDLKQRLEKVKTRMQQSKSKEKLCELMESLVQ